jgi:hypothetical protein
MKSSHSRNEITILFLILMEWVETLLKKSCDNTLTKREVLHSLFHMIEVNENTLNQIQSDKREFGPELEELRKTEINDIDFHIKYYRGLVNFINNISKNSILK